MRTGFLPLKSNLSSLSGPWLCKWTPSSCARSGLKVSSVRSATQGRSSLGTTGNGHQRPPPLTIFEVPFPSLFKEGPRQAQKGLNTLTTASYQISTVSRRPSASVLVFSSAPFHVTPLIPHTLTEHGSVPEATPGSGHTEATNTPSTRIEPFLLCPTGGLGSRGLTPFFSLPSEHTAGRWNFSFSRSVLQRD